MEIDWFSSPFNLNSTEHNLHNEIVIDMEFIKIDVKSLYTNLSILGNEAKGN